MATLQTEAEIQVGAYGDPTKQCAREDCRVAALGTPGGDAGPSSIQVCEF